MKQYKIQNRSQKNSQSCVPLTSCNCNSERRKTKREKEKKNIPQVWWLGVGVETITKKVGKAWASSIYVPSPVLYNQAEGYRGLVQHGGLPGWLKESYPVGLILYMMDDPYNSLPFPYHTGCPCRCCPSASWRNLQLLFYSKCTHPSVMSHVTRERHGQVL